MVLTRSEISAGHSSNLPTFKSSTILRDIQDMGTYFKGATTILLSVVLLISSVFAVENDEQAAQLLYKNSLSLVTQFLSSEVSRDASFCIVDPETDWNEAFNYSSNLNFIASCMSKTQGDASQRLCTAAEIKFYLNNYLAGALSGNTISLKPNKNCNRTSWVSGCESGWACSADPTRKVDLKDAAEVPSRTSSCQPCCEGFFCPQGLTCMIPCPLGSYCPRAELNQQTGLCEPYLYQLPPGRTNQTCGGANIWANIGISKGMFCPAGSYCPSTTENITCSSGHYCRTGSTIQTRCSKLISCKSNTKNEDIHTYGIIFISALGTLLLIIYSFADQILTIRERRRAKSRQKATQSLRESEQARLRWKFAKEAVKKHSDLLMQPKNRMHENQEPVSGDHEANLESGERSQASTVVSNKRISKTRANSADTQMFLNAYTQIEKEKSRQRQTENFTFSRMISMATTASAQIMRKRPLIEIAFKDLTLELKVKKKYLLRCLTGKIVPGHITAVMGPSGAGKTSLLSVLAGKTSGCKTTGLVLINGKPEPIRSYKKITGFVPQDDIVYGNLTVEENLWFSARCRLSCELRKEEKILIVERVIENLGLQEARDSLVGTVEKRGISGGQRKRVNVGWELVMEPSLLFLDEPTSGLDSASSLLLLRALKREAHEGVNICMVVHQPSYALFKMFDDLILLAKGGLMVYHGLVNEVEAYFGSLGYHVPDRVNPPDFYIDILEGIAEQSSNTSVNNLYKKLPLIWMLQNGYPIPEDMQSSSIHGSSSNVDPDHATPMERSSTDELSSHYQRHLFFPVGRKDLSNRKTPSVILQYKYFFGRVIKQRLREAKLQATDYLILLIAGACVGSITKISDADFGAFGYSYTIIAISLLCQVAALRSFSNDKLQYWRERASGMSSLANFMAKETIDHFNTAVKPAVYLSMFYFFTNPRSTFLDNYIVLVSLVYCVTGMGYALAIFFDPGPSQLLSVLLPVCLTLITTQSLSNDGLKFLANFCYPKWALEALVIANARRYYGVWLISRCLALYKYKYSLHVWGLCITVLILFGVGTRIIAFIGLLTVHKR